MTPLMHVRQVEMIPQTSYTHYIIARQEPDGSLLHEQRVPVYRMRPFITTLPHGGAALRNTEDAHVIKRIVSHVIDTDPLGNDNYTFTVEFMDPSKGTHAADLQDLMRYCATTLQDYCKTTTPSIKWHRLVSQRARINKNKKELKKTTTTVARANVHAFMNALILHPLPALSQPHSGMLTAHGIGGGGGPM